MDSYLFSMLYRVVSLTSIENPMAKKHNFSEDLRKIEKGAVRNEMKEQGAFDGRFRPKVVADKTNYKRHSKHRHGNNED